MGTDEEKQAMIVTGASRGIGAAVARELARGGIDVVATARSADDLAELAASLADAPGRVHVVCADVTSTADLERIVEETIGAFGRLDGLVNNAGFLPAGHPVSLSTGDTWDTTMKINLRAPWYLSVLAYPHLKARGGAIVNVTSSAGMRPEVGLGVYGMSKAALIMLTEVCAKEWARDRIRVNAVAPGLSDTEMGAPLLEYLTSRGKPASPLGDLIDPPEVAALIHFLLDDRGRHMTGDVVRIDAGHLLYA